MRLSLGPTSAATLLAAWLLSTVGCFAGESAASPSANANPAPSRREVVELRVDDRKRRCLVHVPEGADPKKPMPLVLLFHGAGANGKWQLRYSGLDETADREGFLLAVPDGPGRLKRWCLTWNAELCCGYASSKDVDDVKFVGELLDELERRYPIDRSRIYATGLSNGGMMCYRLAAEMPERIAAVGIVSGTVLGELPQDIERPVPVLHFHGTKDKLVPFKGGARLAPVLKHFKGARECASLWASRNGCPPDVTVERLGDNHDDHTRVIRESYGPGRGGSEVVLYVIEGGGHTWPGRSIFSGVKAPACMRRLSLLGLSTSEIDANDLLWDFFERHPMKAPARDRRQVRVESR